MRAGHFCVNHSNHGSHDHVLAILELAFLRQCPRFRLSATITHDFCSMFISTNFGQILTADRKLVEENLLFSTPDLQLWLIVDYCIWLAQVLPKNPSQHLDISSDPGCVLSWLRALITVILRQWCVHYGEHHGVPLPPFDNEIRVSIKGIDRRYWSMISIRGI